MKNDNYFSILIRHLKSYGLAYLIIIAHLPGGLTGQIALFITVGWLFLYFVFRKSIDIYLIFLLLVPSIVLSGGGDDTNTSQTPPGLLSHLKNVIIIGPLALSANLALAIATPFRLLVNFKKIWNYKATLVWVFTLILAIIGLFMSVTNGLESKSGLTVGLRIVLSVGAVLIPSAVANKDIFYKYIDKIMFLSFFLLFAGFISEYWVFIVLGFMAYLMKRSKSRLIAILPLIYVIKMAINLEGSLTTIATLFISVIFYFCIEKISLNRLFGNKYFQYILIITPLILTLYTVSLKQDTKGYDITTIQGLVRFKLIGDRKPIWDASFEQITQSPLLLVPAGRSIAVYFDYIDKWDDWQNGSHNIFLEIGRQLGLLSTLILLGIIFYMIIKTGRATENSDDLILFYSFLSVYLVFGLTGQALVYDGAGFFYWFLLGQFLKSGELSIKRSSF